MQHRWKLLCLTLIAVGYLPSIQAVPYGETVIVTTGTPGCPGDGSQTSGVLASVPFAVSAPSRIFASASVSSGMGGTIYAAVTTSTGQVVLGTAPSGQRVVNQGDSLGPPTVAQGVVHMGPTPISPGSSPLVLDEGTYLLQFRVQGTGICASGFHFDSAILTYMLLSAHFDAIFANGFA